VKIFGRVVGFVGTASLALAPALFVSATSASAAPISEVFSAVGSHDWMVPAGVTCVTAEAIGAEGGSNPSFGDDEVGDESAGNGNGADAALAGDGASGGSGTSTFPVVPGASLQVNVGGRGGDAVYAERDETPPVGAAGGFNGGGDGGSPSVPLETGDYASGAGGGGASDVRAGGTDLDHRVAIGGGGGGWGGFSGKQGGLGGGESGTNGDDQPHSTAGTGGTSAAGGIGGETAGGAPVGQDGSKGQGGAGAGDALVTNGGGGGGGGGLYGGGGGGGVRLGEQGAGPGGGGSGLGWDDTQTGVDAGNAGNGKVTLTYAVGDTSCVSAPLTVKKVATGPTTPGQTFTVRVACDDESIAIGDTELSEVDLHFVVDAAGVVQPSAGQSIGFYGPNACTVTETVDGGATTTYECVGSGASAVDPAVDPAVATGSWGVGATTAANSDDPCATSGPQSTPVSVAILSPAQQATVTVTNTMPAAAAVLVTPRFTG
jgi:hypothetical protein